MARAAPTRPVTVEGDGGPPRARRRARRSPCRRSRRASASNGRASGRGLLREAVERLAVLRGEALGEREIVRAPLDTWVVGQTGAERPNVLVVKGVALAQIVRDAADQIVSDAVRGHLLSLRRLA